MEIENIKEKYPCEDSARRFMSEIRWGNMASCPHCRNDKAYFIEKGKRYKCANPDCKKKFSVTTKTLMQGSNIPLNVWLYGIAYYAKARGRITINTLISIFDINMKSASNVDNKLALAWSKINRDIGESLESLIRKMIKSMEFCFELHEESYSGYRWHIGEFDINDMGDERQYFKLLKYTEYYIKNYATWVSEDFTTAQDVIAEAFLKIKDDGIKEYNTEVALRYIRNTYSNMWKYYLKNSKKMQLFMSRHNRDQQRLKSEKLTDGYIVRQLAVSLKTTAKTVRKMIDETPGMIERKRQEIIAARTTNDIIKNSGINELLKFNEIISEYKSKIQ